jgi:hypothetical protein
VQVFGRAAKVQLLGHGDKAAKLFQFIHRCNPGINPCSL